VGQKEVVNSERTDMTCSPRDADAVYITPGGNVLHVVHDARATFVYLNSIPGAMFSLNPESFNDRPAAAHSLLRGIDALEGGMSEQVEALLGDYSRMSLRVRRVGHVTELVEFSGRVAVVIYMPLEFSAQALAAALVPYLAP
jgi:hypothetical protein